MLARSFNACVILRYCNYYCTLAKSVFEYSVTNYKEVLITENQHMWELINFSYHRLLFVTNAKSNTFLMKASVASKNVSRAIERRSVTTSLTHYLPAGHNNRVSLLTSQPYRWFVTTCLQE